MIVGVNVKLTEESGLTPNEVFFLYGLREKKENTGAMVNWRFLQLEDYIDEKGKLTGKGEDFVKSVFLPVKKTPKTSVTDVKELSEAYRELFPVGVKQGNLPVKGNLKNIEKKLEIFVRKYPEYDRELILNATRKYVKDSSKEGFRYMKTAEYFIMKNGDSSLASLCDAYLEGNGETTGSKFGRTI